MLNYWKKNRDYIYYFSAFLGLVAGNMFNYSIVIFSHSLADNEYFASQVFFMAYLPFLFFSFKAGYYLDKYSRKWVILLSQLMTFFSAFTPGLLAYLGQLDSSNKEILYFFALTNGLALSFIMPGRFAILGDLVSVEKISRSTVFLNILILLGFTIAPIIAGFFRELFSYGTLLMTTGFIYIASSFFLISLNIPNSNKQNQSLRKQAFQESLNFVKVSSIVKESLIAMLIGMMSVGPIQVLVPEFGKKVLNLTEFQRGSMMGIMGLGLLIGSIGSSWLSKRFGRGAFVLFSILASGLFVGLVGMIPSYEFVVTNLFLGGIFIGALMSYIPAIIQESTPNHLRGRIMSFYTLIFLLTPAVSGLVYGNFTKYLELEITIAISGLVNFILGFVLYRVLSKLRIYR